MSCERFCEAITAHACGADVSADAAAHLETCARCQHEYDTQRRVLADVDAELGCARTISASPEFLSRVLARTRSTQRPALAWRAPATTWLGLAAAAAIAAGVFFGMRSDSPSAPTPTPVPAVATSREASGRETRTVTSNRQSRPVTRAGVQGENPRGSSVLDSEIRPAAARDGSPPQRQARPVAEPGSAGPEVLVPPDQLRAIARMQELLELGVLKDSALPPTPTENAVTELVVEPLTVPEIKVLDIETINSWRGGAAPRDSE